MLLGALIIMNKPIKNFSLKLSLAERKNIEFIKVICYFDLMLIPATYVLGIWRGYEYLYIFRLIMWGYIIDIICSKLTEKSRMLVKTIVLMAFVGWMVFRLYNTFEQSSLMPYIFEPFAVALR